MAGQRYSPKRPERNIPLGQLSGQIRDQEILSRLGTICYVWSHVEEGMISVLGKLIPGGPLVDTIEVARQIFRAIASPRAQIDVMQSLLERSRHNRNKGPEYDDVLKRFAEAKKTRNAYVHGLWWTHETGKTFLEKPTADEMGHGQARPVTAKDLDAYIRQLMKLQTLIHFTL